MKVKLLTCRAGPTFSQMAGEIVEVTNKEGVAMIATRIADPVTETNQQRSEQSVITPRDKRKK